MEAIDMTDMSKTKMYEWSCPYCKSTGTLRVFGLTSQPKLRMEFSFFGGEKYFFIHCKTEIELVNGIKDNETREIKASVFKKVEDLKGKI